MPNIDHLRLPAGLTDAGISSLAKLSRLEVLQINGSDGSPLTDEALRTICQIHSLKELMIAGNGFTDGGIEMLARLPNLETLNIGRPGLNDETLKRLAELPKLRELAWMYGKDVSVTMSALSALNALAGLESLSASEVRQDNEGLDLSGLRNLKTLRIEMQYRTTRVGDEIVHSSDALQDSDLACLSGLTKLEDLTLGGPGVGDEGMRHLAPLVRLKYLQIGGGPNLTDDGLKHLAHMHRLDSLNISDGRITDRGLECLYPLKTLHILRIVTTAPISGQAIARLRTELPHLQALDISPPQPAQKPVTPKSRIQPRAK